MNLHGAILRGANLRRANMLGLLVTSRSGRQEVRYVDLTRADLTGADLTGASLPGVLYDRHTRWPSGFDPLRRGAVRVP